MTTQRSPRHRTPRSTTSRLLLRAGLALPLLVAAGCTGSTSGPNSGTLFVQTCSLSCTDGQGGVQVFCAIVNVFQNTEISVLFSEPLDPASVGPSTFQVIDVTNGTSPDGQYLIDPLDPRRAIFRPGIVFGGGGVSFAFRANTSYEVLIPGQAQGDSAPFITSVAGNPNQSRLQCTIFTSEGVTDPVPGNPRVEIDVVRVTAVDMQGNPSAFETVTLPLSGPLVDNVWRSSPVVFRFNELMNVATIANNATGTSPFIAVEFDRDGNLATSSSGDRRAIAGRYEFEINLLTFLTTLTFTPSELYPSAGTNPASPRLIVMRVPQQVVDLTNKSVLTSTGGGTRAAIPELRAFQSISIPDADGETFDAPAGTMGSLEDQSHGGANWGEFAGGQTVLAPGLSGGSGRLGEVIVAAGETLELSTDSQVFPITVGPVTRQVDVIGNDVGGIYPFSITVTDGVFEFSSLTIGAGGRLILRGANAARVLVRGPIEISPGGVFDVSGASSGEHDSLMPDGAVASDAGAGGGVGGMGGDRADYTGNVPFLTLAGSPAIANPGAIRDGRAGEGVGGGLIGGGGGGPAYPTILPTQLETRANGTNGLVTMNASATPETIALVDCVSLDMGGPGGGGGYALPGSAGSAVPSIDEPIAEFVPAGASNALHGPPGASGDNSGLALEAPDVNNTGYVVRLLDWENGHLRGGAGGGGGGNHPYLSRTDGEAFIPANCFVLFLSVFSNWTHWHDHSGAAGGGGGGALELLSGKRVDLDGRIDARGGQGGSSLTGQQVTYFGQYAMAGGGGSGGAVRVRAPVIDVLPGGTRIDVRGGLGGNAFWAVATANPTSSRGGDGSRGLVRVEDGQSGPMQVTFAGLRSLVAPFDSGDPNASITHLSVAGNYFTSSPTLRPDSVTASSSCWIQPAGGFDSLGLRADVGTTLAEQGWTMNVVVDQGGTVTKRPFRGSTAQFPTSWEEQFGNLLGYDLPISSPPASPIVVRFQGARSGVTLPSPCNVDPNDFLGPIDAGSLTRWVAHPSELNGILNSQGAPLSPNLIRFVVIFDQTIDPGNNDTPGQILISQGVVGVDDLIILADPE